MNILAFDTSLDKMYVALSVDGDLKSKIIETDDNNYHSAYIISTIKNILKENGLTPKNIDLIATNIGPGSFTGIRACTTVARIMAQQLGLKVVGVSSLEILSRIKPCGKNVVALDARKEMAYVAIFDEAATIQEPQAFLLKDLEHVDICDNKLKKFYPNAISYQEKEYDLGKFLIEIAQNKPPVSWKELLPLYIQPPAVHGEKAQEALKEMSQSHQK